MNGIENIKLKGTVNIVVMDSSGQLKQEKTINNLVVTSGISFITSKMTGGADAVMSHMGVGTSSTPAAAGNTVLLGPLGSRQPVTTTTPTSTTVQYAASFAAGQATGALREAGIFNDITAGTMLCRTVFDPINKAAEDSMLITWTITLAAT